MPWDRKERIKIESEVCDLLSILFLSIGVVFEVFSVIESSSIPFILAVMFLVIGWRLEWRAGKE